MEALKLSQYQTSRADPFILPDPFILHSADPFILPSDLISANTSSSSAIHLRWEDLSRDELGYRIERKMAGEAEWTLVSELAAKTTQYLDYRLKADAEFSYRISAYSATDVSGPYYSCEFIAFDLDF